MALAIKSLSPAVPKSIHDPAYCDLIAQLTAVRRKSNLTQQKVADKLRRPQSYVAKVEGLERRIDVVEFMHLAHAVGADPLPMIRKAWHRIKDADA